MLYTRRLKSDSVLTAHRMDAVQRLYKKHGFSHRLGMGGVLETRSRHGNMVIKTWLRQARVLFPRAKESTYIDNGVSEVGCYSTHSYFSQLSPSQPWKEPCWLVSIPLMGTQREVFEKCAMPKATTELSVAVISILLPHSGIYLRCANKIIY